MDKIGWIGLQLNTFPLGSPNVGKHLNMRECASQITTVNFGGTFAMKNNNDDEGIALLFIIFLLITMTMGLNAFVQLII
jgi:hypothetical protein